MTCPAGCVASHSKKDLAMTEDQRRKGIVFQFTRLQCSTCELRPLCHIGILKVHGRGGARQRLRAILPPYAGKNENRSRAESLP